MTSYQIRVTKLEQNQEFEKQLSEFNQKVGRHMNFDNHPEYPQREVVKNVLLVELNDEQYKAVKLEVLKAFE